MKTKQILKEVFDSYEMLNAMWGKASGRDLLKYLLNKGINYHLDILGYRRNHFSKPIEWYEYTKKLPKNAWIDPITIKPKFRAKNYTTGRGTRYTYTELIDLFGRDGFSTVYRLKAQFKNKRKIFQTEYENYEYVLACEVLAWLKLDLKNIDKSTQPSGGE